MSTAIDRIADLLDELAVTGEAAASESASSLDAWTEVDYAAAGSLDQHPLAAARRHLDHAAVSAEERTLVLLAEALRGNAVQAAPDAGFRAALRTQLVEQARVATVRGPLARFGQRFAERARSLGRRATASVGALGTAAVMLSGGATALAAQGAEPGDLLYGLRLSIDEVRLAFIGDQLERGQAELASAVERIAEAVAAAGAGDLDGAEVALAAASERWRDGSNRLLGIDDADARTAVSTFITTQGPLVAELAAMLDESGADLASRLLGTLADVEAQLEPPAAQPAPSATPTGTATDPPGQATSSATAPPTAGPVNATEVPVTAPTVVVPSVLPTEAQELIDDLGDSVDDAIDAVAPPAPPPPAPSPPPPAPPSVGGAADPSADQPPLEDVDDALQDATQGDVGGAVEGLTNAVDDVVDTTAGTAGGVLGEVDDAVDRLLGGG